jgi:hypothetical protein
MRPDLVQRWIDLSGAVTREETAAIPLIDESAHCGNPYSFRSEKSASTTRGWSVTSARPLKTPRFSASS